MSAQSQVVNFDVSNQSTSNSSENIKKKKPTQTDDECWLYHVNNDMSEAELSRMDEIEIGKWMMYIKKSELDQKWENCCDLYDAGKLTGIIRMKCSTNYKDPSFSVEGFGVIIMYCGPASDECKMLEYGKNLLRLIPYNSKYGRMTYKTDIQHLRCQTDRTKNWLYELPVPISQKDEHNFVIMTAQSQFVNSDVSNKCKANTSKHIIKRKPTQTDDECFLYHWNDIIEAEFIRMDEMEMGKWMMFIKKSELDQKWEDCCDLYDAGKLTGIIRMKCSTNYKNPKSSNHAYGVIIMYCGPASDECKMLEYGKNILKLIPYSVKSGHIAYKSDIQTLGGTRKTGQTKNWLYRIPVPTSLEGQFEKLFV